ncbi:hypothetical protein LXT21_40475 [Myxococcus sp. K38C18041901]|uniref:hypothetical protein n=1 Tax=Myxococcus guangdongensis TaxID=2906760 RepID=UPI0020A81144|nr:hypothetical protein [Myxococcus guangdongensis]MCP3065066.1 hypothetical protein [Myxococcus guangdongensis]
MLEPSQSDLTAMEVATLRGLAEQAVLAHQGETTLDVETLSARLREVAHRGGPPELGTVLWELLSSGTLTTVRDRKGRSCRALAVKALLKLDGPEARRLTPEDLTFGRTPALAPPRWVLVVSAALTTLGGLGTVVVSLVGHTMVSLAFHGPLIPPFPQFLAALVGGLTAWRALKLVIAPEARPADLRALLLLAAAGALLVTLEIPARMEGGPDGLFSPVLAALPAALTAVFFRASGIPFRDNA